MKNDERKAILEKYYFSAKNPASFSSSKKLYKVLQKKYPGKFSISYLEKWLDGIDSYSIQKQVRRKFKTAQV
ncbi:MAG: hypothetical protein N0E45_09500 [Candidatus Thiodiazotropha endolucinida]|nr:hypothetical protein [Candidatus Thiodiazotropha taylori]MCW4299882.1 hypothetical protein [Candidatus Thiodiazotropha endolucinida]